MNVEQIVDALTASDEFVINEIAAQLVACNRIKADWLEFALNASQKGSD